MAGWVGGKAVCTQFAWHDLLIEFLITTTPRCCQLCQLINVPVSIYLCPLVSKMLACMQHVVQLTSHPSCAFQASRLNLSPSISTSPLHASLL